MKTVEATPTPAVKSVAPMSSFLGKLTPKPIDKPKASTPEVKQEVPNGQAAAETVQTPESASGVGAKVDPSLPAVSVEKDPLQPVEQATGAIDTKPKEDKTEKRLKDAQTWGNEEHKARLAAEAELRDTREAIRRLEAKIDGTYQEPAVPSIEQVKAHADLTGRIRASHKAAVRLHGEPFVMETVWNADAPYQELAKRDPRVEARVMSAEDPVLEALAVVKEHQDGLKWGRTPEEMKKNIEAELAPKLKQEILEGLKTKPGPATNTLGNVRGSTERAEQKSPVGLNGDFLATVFPWGRSRR